MTADYRNTLQHNLHAEQAGITGHYPSGTLSSTPWRWLGHFFATTVFMSFALNESWEISQMSAYLETAGHAWTSTVSVCTMAAVGDVGMTVAIYLAGALAFGDLGWGMHGLWNLCAMTAVLGLPYAAPVKHAALSAGRWSYTDRMPVVSVLGAGRWPLLQILLQLPLNTGAPTGGLVATQRKRFRDEPNEQMDEWLDGRRNVVVDSNRRPGNSPAGRRDQQAVQEIVVRLRLDCEMKENCS
jgi:hypothetical protein